MSAVTAIHREHAATKQRLTAVRDEAAARLSIHEKATKANASRLATIEAAYIANATSEALGLEPKEDVPDANVLEKLRAEAAVAEPVRRQLALNLEEANRALEHGEAVHKESIATYLREEALEPALVDWEQALNGLRDAAINVMAAHKLVYHDFNDNRPLYLSANDFSGPVAQWLAALREMNWPFHPYSIRPDWLPDHGVFWPDLLPGVAERTEELLTKVKGGAA